MKKNKLIIATTLDAIIDNEDFYLNVFVCSSAGDLLQKAFKKPGVVQPVFFTYQDFAESREKWFKNPQEFLENIILPSVIVTEQTIFLLAVHPYCADDLFDILDDINNLYQKFDIIDFNELKDGVDEELIDTGEIVSIAIKTKKIPPDYLRN